MIAMEITKTEGIDKFDAFPLRLETADGQRFEKTGNTSDGRPVYCPEGKLTPFVSDDLLYVLGHYFRLVPRREWKP